MQEVANLFTDICDFLIKQNKHTKFIAIYTTFCIYDLELNKYTCFIDTFEKAIKYYSEVSSYVFWDDLTYDQQLQVILLSKKYAQNWFLK